MAVSVRNGNGKWKYSNIRHIEASYYSLTIELKNKTQIAVDGLSLDDIKRKIELIDNAKKGKAVKA